MITIYRDSVGSVSCAVFDYSFDLLSDTLVIVMLQQVASVGGRPRRAEVAHCCSDGASDACLGHVGGSVDSVNHDVARMGCIGYVEVASTCPDFVCTSHGQSSKAPPGAAYDLIQYN